MSSAASRLNGQPSHTVNVNCPKCSTPGAHWDHYWRRWLNMEPPEDILLRRFVWPTCGLDIQIGDEFCEWAAKLLDCHGHAFLTPIS